MNKPEIILFDFANTLSNSNYFNTEPNGCPNWYDLFQNYVFSDKQIVTLWCQGKITAHQIAEIIKGHVNWGIDPILNEMRKGCCNLQFNKAVYNFSRSIKGTGIKTALVTNNIDLFTEVVVPFYSLETIFDVIINSADYKSDNKSDLWSIAFQKTGKENSYHESLLIEDGEKWPSIFEEHGGKACRYSNDDNFINWMNDEHIIKEEIIQVAL
jgi:FMN phosphatase YigB (HAD superfamily)